ncbi:relaxase/mobilization nuclease domain-containing protein [Pseudogemmobacter faecipullorum]|uniref:Relaxase/mobilization nuclease domain-containing protein n=1 Tax=Pseudogemmobacter faecipullorum TaxID=2755041 RepID=A0ABS8CS12_9RHOB|nr:relaxase/mobilization nuclease domain-containing protein [Pseudogemmobacter faecipullorum]MCB5412188.1 relaxase/mobilization nuclease domain-containing protein [Pseudogemmobacter faecipullorum]
MPTVRDAQGLALGFTRRGRYVWRNKVAGQLVNVAGDIETAIRRMQLTAQLLKPAVRKPDYHVVLAWHLSEKITYEEILGAGIRFMNKIGAGEHQALLAAHDNTEQRHLHIVLNRVHPWNGTALALRQDYTRGERACREIELEMGFTRDRGRFDAVIEHGKVELRPRPAEHWERRKAERAAGLRGSGRATRGSARARGLVLLRDGFAGGGGLQTERSVQRLRKDIAQAESWAAVQSACRAVGLVYEAHRSGGRLRSLAHGHHMAACEIGSAASLPRLEARLGPLSASEPWPGPAIKHKRTYRRRPEIAAIHDAFEQQMRRLAALFGDNGRAPAGYLRRALQIDLRKALRACRERLRSGPMPGRPPAPEGIRGALARRFLARGVMTGSAPLPDHTDLRQMMEMTGAEMQAGLSQVRDLQGRLWTALEVGRDRRLAGFLNEAPSPPLLAEGAHPSTAALLAHITGRRQEADADCSESMLGERSASGVALRPPEVAGDEPAPF